MLRIFFRQNTYLVQFRTHVTFVRNSLDVSISEQNTQGRNETHQNEVQLYEGLRKYITP